MKDGLRYLFVLVVVSIGIAIWNTDYWVTILMNQIQPDHPIARSEQTEGSVYRRFKNAVTWFPLSSGKDRLSSIFENDRIATGFNSTSTIDFLEFGKVTVQAQSLVQVRFYGGKPMLILQSGNIDVSQAQPGLYIASQGQKPVEIKKSKRAKVTTASKNQKDDLNEEVVKSATKTAQTHGLASEVIEEEVEIQKLQIFPLNESYILLTSSRDLLVSLNDLCVDRCLITVNGSLNSVPITKRFEKGERIEISVPVTPKTSTYRWFFNDSFQKQNGSFEVRAYSATDFSEAVKTNKPVTVL